ncbi:MAG: endonuclease/exonuclease/phosphatase family protein [Pyrinomonadaceae bacterium]
MLLTRRSRITWLAIFILFVLSAPSVAHLNSENSLAVPHDLRPNQDPRLLEIGQASKLQSPANSPAQIKVISYNIRWRGGDDLRQLIELLKRGREIGGAAIIGLQEVDRNKERTEHKNTVKLIAETLGFYYAWTAPPATKAGQEEETGVAILSSYPLADIHRIILPHGGPGGRRRVALGATVALGGARIRVYSVHSENRISVARKMDQTKAVLTNLAGYSKDMPAIILGDLNTWEPDAVDKTSKLFTSENFSTPFDDDQATFLRTILIIPIKLKLDWIWLRGLEATSHGIDKQIDLSDHWPLWVVIKIRKGHSREI